MRISTINRALAGFSKCSGCGHTLTNIYRDNENDLSLNCVLCGVSDKVRYDELTVNCPKCESDEYTLNVSSGTCSNCGYETDIEVPGPVETQYDTFNKFRDYKTTKK